MDTPIKGKPVADLRDCLAEERTFLAWIRTGIALMGFGLVVAHFELFADEPYITQYASAVHPHGPSLWIVALFLALLGIAMTIYLTLALGQPPDALHA